MILDQAGNLYGGTANGTNQGEPVVYEISPSGNGWIYNLLHTFPPLYGGGPGQADLMMDAAGNLYGTTVGEGDTSDPYGNVFKLTLSNGIWVYTDPHDFTNRSDGGRPLSNVVIDTNGNLYGTASTGGANNLGTVWEITP